MAWRSLLTTSGKRYTDRFINGFRNTFERSAVRVTGTYVANPEVSSLKVSEANEGLMNSHSLAAESAPQSAPLMQDCVNPINLSDIISQSNIQIENGEVLYSRMSNRELLSTLFNLSLVSYEPVLDLTIKMLESPLFQHSILRIPVLQAVKQTAYSHFCAGENAAEASATLQRMRELGLKGIPYSSLEDAMDNASCDQNLEKFLSTLDTMLRVSPGSVSFACVKITALCPLSLLERVSDLLRWQHRHPEHLSLPWMEETLPIFSPCSPTYHTSSPPEALTASEETDLKLAQQRLHKYCKFCEQKSLPLLVDAEYTSVQPAIAYLTYHVSLQYNKSGKPLVYGTIQAYLKDALPRMQVACEEAGRRGIQMGVKLVRGAYIVKESALAASLGAPSPIHSSIEETHRSYDACARVMMGKAAKDQASLVLATHNFNSGKAAAAKAGELNLRAGNDRIQFAQLKGMADSLSLGLVQAGFQVSKCIPFGTVDEVIPYLIRRAQENRGLFSTTRADRHSIRKELNRRLQAVKAG